MKPTSDKKFSKKPSQTSSDRKFNDKPKSKGDFEKKAFKKPAHKSSEKSQFSKPEFQKPQSSELSAQEKALFLMEDDLEHNSESPENQSDTAENQPYQRNYCFIDGDEDISDFSKVNYVTVTRSQHDQRVDNFLLARLKGLPRSHVYNMIRSDEIRVNKKRCKPYDKLVRGDIVRIAPVQLATREKPVISTDFAKGLLERIVYEDEGLLVLNKPSGMAVHGGSGEAFGVIEAMREATGKKYLELVHRIDKDTSGLLMIAKKRSTLKKLQDHLREKTIQKTYQALVTGWVKENSQVIDKALLKYNLPPTTEGKGGERRVKVDIKNPDSKPSQTKVKVKSRFELDKNGVAQKVSFVECQPLTGRTHQIRVHMASIGHALLGDDKYNPQDKSGVKRLCLHAWRLQIPEYEVIEVELPSDMRNLIV